MNNVNDLPSAKVAAPIVPVWRTFVLLATLLLAALFILFWNVYIGGLLFISAIFIQAYAGFSKAQRIETETRARITWFLIAWLVCTLLAVALQSAIPAFDSVLQSFGADLPVATMFVQKIYPAALFFPLLVAMVWHFWPNRATRLRAAIIVACLCSALILSMFASMYLPILRLGSI